ncbi:MAG: cbb3-type cytochrome oxidase assembly protein CcoS [Cyclobacteriaceae bacterium]
MSVIIILIACSLFLAVGFLIAYLWASRSGQFEDDYTPSVRMLFEDDDDASAKSINKKS